MNKNKYRLLEETLNILYCNEINGIMGKYKGYNVVVKNHTKKEIMVEIFAIPNTQEMINRLTKVVDEIKNKYANVVIYGSVGKKITIGLKENTLIENQIIEIITTITDYLAVNAIGNKCASCGQEKPTSMSLISNQVICLCEDCKKGILDTQTKKQGSLVLGIIGACLGALLGVVLWSFFYQLGYIVGIVGAVTLFFVFDGYKLFNGSKCYLGVTICVIISLLSIILGEYTGVFVAGFREGSFDIIDYFNGHYFSAVLDNSKAMGEMIAESLIGYLLYLICGVKKIYQSYKEVNSNKLKTL